MSENRWTLQGDTLRVQNVQGDLHVKCNSSGSDISVHARGPHALVDGLDVTNDNGVVTIKGSPRVLTSPGGLWRRLRSYFVSSVGQNRSSSVQQVGGSGGGRVDITGAGTGLVITVNAPYNTRVMTSNVNGVTSTMG